MSDLLTVSRDELQEMLSRAGAEGAKVALKQVGLHDLCAGEDIRDLRGVLSSWRDAKKIVWRAFWTWLARWVAIIFLAGICFKMGLLPWPKP